MAVKLTSPAPTRVINVPDALIVATAVLLLLYVIAPLLLLVGNAVALKAASPYAFVVATENVLAESVDVPTDTVSVAVMLPSQYVVATFVNGGPDTQFEIEPDRLKFCNVPVYPPVIILFVVVFIPLLLPFAVP